MAGEAQAWRDSIYYHYCEYPEPHRVAPHYGVRTERHKLVYYYQTEEWELFDLGGRTVRFVLLADVFTVLWLLGMMFTTKLLDGLDGLVSGITTIGMFILFALSLTDKTFQPDLAMLAIVLAGAAAGDVINVPQSFF